MIIKLITVKIWKLYIRNESHFAQETINQRYKVKLVNMHNKIIHNFDSAYTYIYIYTVNMQISWYLVIYQTIFLFALFSRLKCCSLFLYYNISTDTVLTLFCCALLGCGLLWSSLESCYLFPMVAIVDILVLVPSHHSPNVSYVNLEGTGRIDDLSTTAKCIKTQSLWIIHGMYLLKRETQYMYLYLCYWSCLENAFVMKDIFITASLIPSSMIFLLRWNIMYDRSSILLRNLPYIGRLFKFTKSIASFTICAAPVVL